MANFTFTSEKSDQSILLWQDYQNFTEDNVSNLWQIYDLAKDNNKALKEWQVSLSK